MKIGMDVSSHDENDAASDNEDEAGDDSFIDVVFGFLATISVIFFRFVFCWVTKACWYIRILSWNGRPWKRALR